MAKQARSSLPVKTVHGPNGRIIKVIERVSDEFEDEILFNENDYIFNKAERARIDKSMRVANDSRFFRET